MGKKKAMSGIRPGSIRVEGYNEGLVVYLYDAANRDVIIQQGGLARVDACFADPEAKAKSTRGSGDPLLAYELPQDDPICLDIVVGPPLSREERKAIKGRKSLAPQSSRLDLPSGKLSVESANSSRLNPEEPPMEPSAEVTVPPGSYVVTLYRLEQDPEREDDSAQDDLPNEIVTLTPEGDVTRKPRPVLLLRHPSGLEKRDVAVCEVRDGAFDGLAVFWEHWDYFALNLDREALNHLGTELGSILEVSIGRKKYIVICLEGARLKAVELAASAHLFDLKQLPGDLSESPEIALGLLQQIEFARRPVLWCLRVKASEPAKRLNKWVKATGRVLPGRVEIVDEKVFGRWRVQDGQLHCEVLAQKPRQLFLNCPPEALREIGAEQDSTLQVRIGTTSLSARFLSDPAKLSEVLQEASPLSTEERREEWRSLIEQYYGTGADGKAELRERIREFLTPDPANVALPVEHWVLPDREVLLIQPIAGNWENFDILFDFGSKFEAGEKVTIELRRDAC